MKFKLLITGLLFTQFVFAQVPGYMGKRFIVGYSNYFSPALLGRTANSTETSLRLNSVNCINLEYTMKNSIDFCFGIQFWKTGVLRNNGYTYNYTYYDSTYNNYYSEGGEAYYMPSNKLAMQLKSTIVSIGFKFFRSGYIAPAGKYTKLDFLFFKNNVVYEKDAFYKTKYRSPEYKLNFLLGNGNFSSSTCAIALTFGKQRVIFNRIIIDSGIRFAVSPNVIFNVLGGEFLDNDIETMEYQMKLSTNSRIFTGQLVNFHLGIGFLAF